MLASQEALFGLAVKTCLFGCIIGALITVLVITAFMHSIACRHANNGKTRKPEDAEK